MIFRPDAAAVKISTRGGAEPLAAVAARPDNTAMSAEFRIGTSGWSYSDWRGKFYPRGLAPGRWLAHYAATFDTVEEATAAYDFYLIEEDEDNPGFFDAVDHKCKVYAVEPA